MGADRKDSGRGRDARGASAQAEQPARTDRPSGKQPDPEEVRTPFEIDRDRLLYSVPFRRLAGVTQVVSPGEGEIFHNRLTHSIKVAQVARRLAERLKRKFEKDAQRWGGLDPEVAEAAALAHDLGHPPFGHVSEYELSALVSEELCKANGHEKDPRAYEGYEGNAQSFRIVTDLAVRRTGAGHGLDLTRATLHATLKYPWKWKEHPEKPNKYGAYGCDDEPFRFARGILPPVEPPVLARSLEAQIMDWADDITYSVHDTEDFYRAGLIPLDRLASVTAERDHFRDNLLARAEAGGKPITADRMFDKIFSGLFNTLKIRDRYEGTREQQELLSDFVSSNIKKFITGTKLVDPPGRDGEGVDYPEDIKVEVFLLKQLIWTYVIENPSLASHQLGQRRAIRVLFKEFNDAAVNKHWPLFPGYFRERAMRLYEEQAVGGAIPPAARVRLVADTIASLTDRQALLVYQQFVGVSPTSMLDPTVR
jgi:dGTPase